jgi:hypothetical protein
MQVDYRCPECGQRIHAPAHSNPSCPACLLALRPESEAGCEFGLPELTRDQRAIDKMMRSNGEVAS